MTPSIGMHACIATAEGLQRYTQAFVKYLVPKGVNFAVLELNTRFQFQSYPQVSGGDITAEDLKKACDTLRENGVEPIPSFNCLGHQGWSERNTLLKAFPEFDESPWLKDNEDFIPVFTWAKMPEKDKFGRSVCTYTPAWCGNEPRVYDVVLPLLDELIDASGCKTFHFGMDEIIMLGECERCRGLSRAELFRKNLTILHDHCQKRNVRSMIWSDRLLNALIWHPEMTPAPGKELSGEFDNLGTYECIDDIPKDIILCDWHYGKNTEHFTGELLSHGFTVYPSCWDVPENAELLWKNALEEAEKQNCKDRLPGMLICCWGGGNNLLMPFEDPDNPALPKELSRLPSVLDKVSSLMKEYARQ